MAGGEQSYVWAMLAKVSPASYLLMIDGQSCWGIFPLLVDLSISTDLLAATLVSLLGSCPQIRVYGAPRGTAKHEIRESIAKVTIAAGQLADA
jgi:hypothetical protein